MGRQEGVVIRGVVIRRYNNDFGVTITGCRFMGTRYSVENPGLRVGVVIRGGVVIRVRAL